MLNEMLNLTGAICQKIDLRYNKYNKNINSSYIYQKVDH